MASVRPTKRKKVCHRMETKYQAIIQVEKGVKKNTVAKQFNIPLSTLLHWLKSADELKDVFLKGGNASYKRKRMKGLENALYTWFRKALRLRTPLTGAIVKKKASTLAFELGYPSFESNETWLLGFKERYSISFRTMYSEIMIDSDSDSVSVNDSQIDGWLTTTLPNILDKYAPQDIYNADESGLFYKLLPSKSLVYKGETCSSGKQSQERLTILACANMSGTHKLPMLVIGKSVQFKGVKSLPTEYVANEKAWMTTAIFSDWLQKQDQCFGLQQRKIALILDNIPSHPNLKLNNIDLFFLPPKTTSKSQPMEQGIVKNLKEKYRLLVLSRLTTALKTKEYTRINVLQALNMIQHAWSQVSAAFISNCFKLAQFTIITTETPDKEQEEDEFPLEEILQQARAAGVTFDGTLADYITVDDQLTTTAPKTDSETIQSVEAKLETLNDQSSDEEEGEPIPSSATAVQCCNTLRQYSQDKNATPMFTLINDLERFIQQIHTTTAPKTDSETVQSVEAKLETPNDQSSDEEDEEEGELIPSSTTAVQCCNTLRQYIQGQENATPMVTLINDLERFIQQTECKKQTLLKDCFTTHGVIVIVPRPEWDDNS